MSTATKNQERLAGIIAEIVTTLGLDVGDCNLGPGPDICALGDEAVAALKARLGSTPSGRAEELITQLEAEIVKRDARIAELEAEIAEWSPVMQRLGDENQSLRAALKAQQPGGVVLPDDRELLDFAMSEQFLLFCDEEEFLDIAKSVLSKFARLNPCRAQSVPDGYVMVPVDPTPEMLDRYPFNVSAVTSEPMDKEDLRVVYQAMLAAAPSAKKED